MEIEISRSLAAGIIIMLMGMAVLIAMVGRAIDKVLAELKEIKKAIRSASYLNARR